MHGDGSTLEKVEMVDDMAGIASYIEITHIRKSYCDYVRFSKALECDNEVDAKTLEVTWGQLEKYRLGYYAACLQWYMCMCVLAWLSKHSLSNMSLKNIGLSKFIFTLKMPWPYKCIGLSKFIST